jgi:membrane protease YdiL (CAAX protease family)
VTIVPCCLAIASLLALATHVQHIDPVNDMLQLLHDAGAPPDAVPAARIPQMLAAGTLAALTIAVPINALFTFGEEFGWRGYLLPQLLRAMPATPAALLVGAIWGAWHAPLILLDGFNFPNDRPLGVVFMIALCMAMSLILCALRLASHSIWPSSLAHAALNAQAGVVLVLLAPLYSYAGAPLGLAAIVVFAVAGVVLMRTLIPR